MKLQIKETLHGVENRNGSRSLTSVPAVQVTSYVTDMQCCDIFMKYFKNYRFLKLLLIKNIAK